MTAKTKRIPEPSQEEQTAEVPVRLTKVGWQNVLLLLEAGIRHSEAGAFEVGGALLRSISTQVKEPEETNGKA